MKYSISLLFFSFSFFARAQDTSGTYQPVVVEINNITSVNDVGIAHFIRKDSVCSVWGRIGFNGTIASTNTRAYFKLTQPIPSTLVYADDAHGGISAVQNGTHTIGAGYIFVVPSGQVFFTWNAVAPGPVNVYYWYTYTIK
jgi:hypothetical protein